MLGLALLLAPSAKAQKPEPKAGDSYASSKPSDPLGRESPYGTVTGFVRAAEKKDFERAARYLQIPRRQPSQRDQETARQLGFFHVQFTF